MMKRTGIVMFALLFVFGAAFASDNVAQKQDVLDAIDAFNNGQPMTAAQKELARDHIGNDRQIDNTGGPDGYGYVFKDSEEADGPAYAWVDNTGNGTEFIQANGMGDEDEAGPFPLGQTFNFYGNDYTEFWVESNGVITFTDPGSGFGFSTEALPTDDGDVPAVFPMWNDFDVADGFGYYSYEMVGDMMATVVTFVDVDEYPDGADQENATFQAIFFEDGSMKFQYANFTAEFDVTDETIGIQQSPDGPALQVSRTEDPTAYPYNSLAVEIYVDNDIQFASVSGTVTDADGGAGIEGATVTVGTATATTDVDGMYTLDNLLPGDYDWTVEAAGYTPDSGMITLVEGANTLDAALDAIDYTGDVLLVDVDPAPGSAMELQPIIEQAGYSTVRVTDFFEVPFGDYEYVFVFCGIYSDDFDIATGSDEEAALIDYLNGGGNLYIEGGDVLAYTPPANLMDLVPVNGVSDGGSDMDNVVGVAGTFTDGFDLAYTGENNYMDHLEVDGDATLVLTNPADDAGHGIVSADFAGFSLELGFLTDGDNGTRLDIVNGIFDAFNTTVQPDPVEVTLTPTGSTEIPANGGTLEFDVNVVSNQDQLYTGVWFYTTVMLPNGNMYYQNLFQTQFNMPPMFDITQGMTQDIPDFAPEGAYTLYGNIAGNPNGNGPHFMGSFDFTKLAATAAGEPVTGWDATGGDFSVAGEADAVATLPAEFELAQVYPNPFNPTANVSVALPTAAELTVAVYNVMGQQVAELASGQMNAGTHNFVLDGSNLSSGIYFVQATVPGELNAVQKVTLMK